MPGHCPAVDVRNGIYVECPKKGSLGFGDMIPPPKFCVEHRPKKGVWRFRVACQEDGKPLPGTPTCIEANCDNPAAYSIWPGYVFCADHKVHGMTPKPSRQCEAQSCGKYRLWGPRQADGHIQQLRCSEHKLEGDEKPTHHHKPGKPAHICQQQKGCSTIAHWNFPPPPGKSLRQGQHNFRQACYLHKLPGMVRASPMDPEWRQGVWSRLLQLGFKKSDNKAGGDCLYHVASKAVGVGCQLKTSVAMMRGVAGQPATQTQLKDIFYWGDTSHMAKICVAFNLICLVLMLDYTTYKDRRPYNPFWWEPQLGKLLPIGPQGPPKVFIAVGTTNNDDETNHWFALKGPDKTLVWESYDHLPQVSPCLVLPHAL